MKISLIGCGWFGRPLARRLLPQHEIFGTTRSHAEALTALGIEATLLTPPQIPNELLKHDIVVLNIPPFEGQLEWFKAWPWPRGVKLIFISSTSVYGQDGKFSESDAPVPESGSGKLLLAQEAWVRTFPHHAIIRFGGLLGGDRHPGKHLAGKSFLADGDSPVNLLHQDDAVGFVELVIEENLTGTWNLVADAHPTRAQYYRAYAAAQGLPLPEFVAGGKNRIILNDKVKSVYRLKVPTP